MSVETIQCPKCGAPLQVEQGRRSQICSHCAASLIITQDSSGHPLATLDATQNDTGVVAEKKTLQRLDEILQSKEEEIEALRAERIGIAKRLQGMAKTKKERTNNLLLGFFFIVAALLLFALSVISSEFRSCIVIGVLFLFIGAWILIKAPKKLVSDSQVDPQRLDLLRSRIETVYREIQTLKQRKVEQEAEFDQQTGAN